jgi:arylsulfatase A-like enzyme
MSTHLIKLLLAASLLGIGAVAALAACSEPAGPAAVEPAASSVSAPTTSPASPPAAQPDPGAAPGPSEPALAQNAEPRPSLVIVTLDTTRADHLGTYGHDQATSPFFDRMTEDGVTFLRAYAPMPQTLPSHSTIFTGMTPREHGATENHQILPESVTTLAETLKGEGYDTAAFIGARVVEAESGLGQGFDTFGEPVWTEERARHADRRAEEVVKDALTWAMTRDKSKPYFLWVHLFDPHAPFEAPPPYHKSLVKSTAVESVMKRFDEGTWVVGEQPPRKHATGYANRHLAYDQEISYTDNQLGRLSRGLTKFGMMKDTALVIAADHGEGLFEHGIQGHGLHVHEELMHVPLFVQAPDKELAGLRVDAPISLKDVRPMALRILLGDDADAHLDDPRDPWTSLRRTAELPLEPIFLERPHYSAERFLGRLKDDGPDDLLPGPLVAVLMDHMKLVRHPDGREELFDLSADPHELVDVSGERASELTALRRLLDRWLEDQPAPGEGEAELSEERRKALEQLGYGR